MAELANVNWETDFGTPLSQEEFAEFYEWLLTRPNKPTFFRDTEPIEILDPSSIGGVTTAIDIRVENGVNFFPQHLRAVEGEHGTQHVLLAFVVTQVDGENVLKLGAFSVDWGAQYGGGLLKIISESKKMQIVILTKDANAPASKNLVLKDVTGSNPARDKLEQGVFDTGPVPLFISAIFPIF